MSYSTGKRIIVGKLESTAGTAETLADADFNVRARGIEVSPELEVDDEASKYATGDYLEDESVAGLQKLSQPFTVKMAPSGTPATVDPAWWKFMEGCGCTTKNYTTTGVAIQDDETGDTKTMTIESFDIARGSAPVAVKDQSAGAMGNAVLSVDAVGGVGMVAFNFTGKYTGESDVTNANIPVLTSPDTTVAPAFKNATVTIGGVATCLKNFSLDMGNTISPELCPAEATGILNYKIDSRAPRLTVTFLMPAVSTYGALSKWSAETVEAVSIAWGDFTLKIPRAQILTFSKADESGSIAYQMTMKCLRNGGSDSDIADGASFELLQGARA